MCNTEASEILQQTHLPVRPFAGKVYAETGNNSRLVLETHGGQVQAATQKQSFSITSLHLHHKHWPLQMPEKMDCRFNIMPLHQPHYNGLSSASLL